MVEQIIMRSEGRKSSSLAMESIEPTSGYSFLEQMESCLEQLSEFGACGSDPDTCIIQQSFFIAADHRDQYEERAALIREKLQQVQPQGLPATAYVAQTPAAGREVVLELICTLPGEKRSVEYKNYAGQAYTLVSHPDYKIVYANGLSGAREDSILSASEKAFEALKGILDSEGLQMQDIVRQWNYVEDIAHVKGKSTQNYQIFNDVRTRYYEMGDFSEGYPAATGIGMNTAGVILGFIAVSQTAAVNIKPIRNPRQIDAHSYSKEMLLGEETGIMAGKCTPKFERAKMLKLGGLTHIYISGTASIVGEKSLHVGDVQAQTHTTIDNILELLSRENQKVLDLDFDPQVVHYSHLRVYVKRLQDIPAVQAICEERLNCKSSLYLQADICRDELLVEIEGMFTLS